MNLLDYFLHCHENPQKNQYILYSDPLEFIFFETDR